MNSSDQKLLQRRHHLFAIAACFAISLFCLAYPTFVIRPSRYQSPRELAAALAVMRFRPGLEMLCVACALFAAFLYWRAQPKLLRKIAVMIPVALVCLFAGLSRVNHFEQLMFHPLGRPSFQAISDTKLDGDEMVIAVNLGGEARAYPIRSVSYHHIVNDVVGGVAIAATY